MKVSQKVMPLIQKQIMNETTNSMKYIHLANWCAYNGYNNMAELMRNQASDELDHRDKFIELLLDSGYMPEAFATEKFAFDIKVLEDVVKIGLKTEQKTTSEIVAIATAASEDMDCNVKEFTMWFIAEQREEEALFIDMMDFCTNIGLFDKDTPEWAKKQMRNELEKRVEESLED